MITIEIGWKLAFSVCFIGILITAVLENKK